MNTINRKEKLKNTFYYVVIFCLSFTLAYLVQTSYLFKGILALPAAGTLLSFLYKMYRDERAYERSIELQNKQQDFILGTASHMADVAYDKHVEFCEDYINRVQQGFQELLSDGPSKNSMTIGRELVNIRQKHSAWLTRTIEERLKPFEQALIKIGVKEHYLEIAKLPIGVQRTKVVEEIYRSFGLILGHEKSLNEEEANLHIDKIVENIREILGINILTELRLKAAEFALKRINNT